MGEIWISKYMKLTNHKKKSIKVVFSKTHYSKIVKEFLSFSLLCGLSHWLIFVFKPFLHSRNKYNLSWYMNLLMHFLILFASILWRIFAIMSTRDWPIDFAEIKSDNTWWDSFSKKFISCYLESLKFDEVTLESYPIHGLWIWSYIMIRHLFQIVSFINCTNLLLHVYSYILSSQSTSFSSECTFIVFSVLGYRLEMGIAWEMGSPSCPIFVMQMWP